MEKELFSNFLKTKSSGDPLEQIPDEIKQQLTPHEWKDDEIISAELLNKIESSKGLILGLMAEGVVLNQEFSEFTQEFSEFAQVVFSLAGPTVFELSSLNSLYFYPDNNTKTFKLVNSHPSLNLDNDVETVTATIYYKNEQSFHIETESLQLTKHESRRQWTSAIPEGSQVIGLVDLYQSFGDPFFEGYLKLEISESFSPLRDPEKFLIYGIELSSETPLVYDSASEKQKVAVLDPLLVSNIKSAQKTYSGHILQFSRFDPGLYMKASDCLYTP